MVALARYLTDTWSPITVPGQNAIFWLIKEPSDGRVLIDHSMDGVGSLDEGKSYSAPTNKEVITPLVADATTDVFYAKCKEPNQTATLIVDDYLIAVSAVDPQNSTDTPLGPGEEFVGAWIDVTIYGIGYASVFSDVESALEGFRVEHSTDSINVDQVVSYTIAANIGQRRAIEINAQYMRLRYLNGTAPQTEFRLQLKLNLDGLPSTHRVRDITSAEEDARLNKSVLVTRSNDLDFDQYRNVSINDPVPVAGDQLYPHDINTKNSSLGNFSGEFLDLLHNRWSVSVDSTANNPKSIVLSFERPMRTHLISLEAMTGDFSNTVIKYSNGNTPDITLLDESTDVTLKQFLDAPTTPITLTKLILEFHTANPVSLSFIRLDKSPVRIAHLRGRNPQDLMIDCEVTRLGDQKVALNGHCDSYSIDAQGKLRTSHPTLIFDSKLIHDKQELFWDELLGGTATSLYQTGEASVRMEVAASSSDFAIRQTKQRFNCVTSKTQVCYFTLFGRQEPGVTKRAGLFCGMGVNFMTPRHGIFLSISGTEIRWNIAKNGVITESVERADWNYDKLNTFGPTNFNLDINGINTGVIDFNWAGTGRVRVGFMINGKPRYVHYFNHNNNSLITSAYLANPNLPMRMDIQSDGSGGGYLDHFTFSLLTESGHDDTGISRSIDTENIQIDANSPNTAYIVLALRLKQDHLNAVVLPEYISMISETNDDFRWSLHINPTFTDVLPWVDLPYSSCQWAHGSILNIITNDGIKFDSGYAKHAGYTDRQITTSLRIGSTIQQVRDILAFAVMPTASNADFQGSFTFKELL